jgi:hypothetical protein
MNHIGDVYISSIFLKLICNQNKNINFFFYTINGDFFFENIENLTRIYPIQNKYSNYLVNGNPPENLLDNCILKLLLINNMERNGSKILNVFNKDYLFINTWCASEYLKHIDYDLITALNSYKKCISLINSKFCLSLKFNINNINELIPNYSLNYVYDNKENLEDTLFIFNFKPRSENYNMNDMYNFIHKMRIKKKIILSSYDKQFDNSYDKQFDNSYNIKFIDKDYDINPIPSCKNLIELWEIAIKCEKIILLPTGGSWTFFHKLKQINHNQIYILNNSHYCNILNNNINLLLEKNVNLINNINSN